MLDIAIILILALAVVLTLPRWSYSRGWGNRPAQVSGALLLAFVAFWYVLGPALAA